MESRRAAARRGPVAQLGARVNGIHEVTGSNPVWSTTPFLESPVASVGREEPLNLGVVTSCRQRQHQQHTGLDRREILSGHAQ